MRIHNSLTNKKEGFEPLNPPDVNIYTCGVTVYDESHIGHARSLYTFDVMRRYLEYKDYNVNFVRNITDIDDKIINRANELKIDWKELVDKYIQSYKKDLELLGVRQGTLDKDGEEPRATKNIPDMIKYIQSLIDKGYAYAAQTGVYFSVRKFSEYGKLSGQSIDQMQAGSRIDRDETKQDPLDFALWKISKEGEPSWDSPWGKGRPGWHIECSVMSQKFLKTDTLDIHAGGRDLIFPHHENETAQSEAYTGKQFAKFWIHHGLLTINGQKMSKSLGNFITIKDALEKYNSDELKIFFLQAHYSSPIDFSDDKMVECKNALERFHIFFDKMQRRRSENSSLKEIFSEKWCVPSFGEKIKEIKSKFFESMDDDFNTPQALGCLFEILKEANKDSHREYQDSANAESIIRELGSIFGLFSAAGKKLDDDMESYVKAKIDERNKARAEKKFKLADSIRDELLKQDIILEDGAEGTTWRQN
ncbi:cysteine--tRNA ligase [Candidatus Omnitrophota bacterium]